MKNMSHPEYEALAERACRREGFGAEVNETRGETSFLLWAPAAHSVELAVYPNSTGHHRTLCPMHRETDGCYVLTLFEDLSGQYYTYLIRYSGDERCFEIVDPWAKASSANSRRGLILNPRHWDPEGFRSAPLPPPVDYGQTVIYELSVRDFTIHFSAGNAHPGLYLGLAQTGTDYEGFSTGLDHLVDLGITHVHLMPVQDFATTDELTRMPYNWGYDPVLFDVPEGSFATEPMTGQRIFELKAMIHAMHQKGLRVVLDVVYNHTYVTHHTHFQRMAPHYFYRTTAEGYSNGSGCGNELATERSMVRKRIMDSLYYWLEEYRVDGFRFDLMGLFDQTTVSEISRKLLKRRPDLLIYGEPWTAGDTILPEELRFGKGRQKGLGIAIFNDAFKNVFLGTPSGPAAGYLQNGRSEAVDPQLYAGICAGIACAHHPESLADSPSEVIHYLSTHDNLMLRDKLEASWPDATEAERLELTCLAFNVLLTSFGMPLIHSGSEFYRTKFGNDNSYNAPDEINAVRWSNKFHYFLLFEHVRQLIRFRLSSGLFSLSPETIRRSFEPIQAQCLAYHIRRDQEQYTFYHNPGEVHLVIKDLNRSGSEIILEGLNWYPEPELTVKVPAKGSLILRTNI